jgi:hypothetical protein
MFSVKRKILINIENFLSFDAMLNHELNYICIFLFGIIEISKENVVSSVLKQHGYFDARPMLSNELNQSAVHNR